MSFKLQVLFALSIALPVTTGLLRNKTLKSVDYPFLAACCLGLLNELISILSIYKYRNNAVNSNIYVLLETILFLWLFANWTQNLRRYTIAAIAMGIVWLADNFWLSTIDSFMGLYRLCYALMMFYLTMSLIHTLLAGSPYKAWYNGRFIICIALFVNSTIRSLIEIFYLTDIKMNAAFEQQLFSIIAVTNLFLNLLFSYALLCLTAKKKYLMLSSLR